MDNKKYVLILSVGGSPKPLIKSVSDANPEIVYFLHSEDSKKDADEVKSHFKDESIEWEYRLIKDHESIKDTFDTAFKLLNELDENKYFIHLDFTGGTKAMSSGLVLASTNFSKINKYTYVGSSSKDGRDKEGVGIVRDGSELIKNQFNPYEIYALKEFDKGMSFFNNYQFNAALDNFKSAEEMVNDEKGMKLAKFYQTLIYLYSAWDKFEAKVNYHNPKTDVDEKILLTTFLQKKILDVLNNDELLSEDKEVHEEFYAQIELNLKFLRNKISKGNRHINENIKYYLPDLINNANRRIEEGKYDDAVARLYRAMELIAQVSLNEKGVISKKHLKNNLVFYINKNAFEFETKNKRGIVGKLGLSNNPDFMDEESSTFKLPSRKSYELLRCLDSDEARQYIADTEMSNLVNSRNDSILAHGLEPINKDLADKLYDKILLYAKLFYPDIEENMKMAEFPKFNI